MTIRWENIEISTHCMVLTRLSHKTSQERLSYFWLRSLPAYMDLIVPQLAGVHYTYSVTT